MYMYVCMCTVYIYIYYVHSSHAPMNLRGLSLPASPAEVQTTVIDGSLDPDAVDALGVRCDVVV